MLGIVALAPDGAVLWRAGLGALPGVADALRPATLSQRAQRTMHVLDAGGHRLVALILRWAEGWACFVHTAEAESTLVDFVASVDFAWPLLEHMLASPYSAVTVVDRQGILRFLSPVHARFFGLAPGSGIGRPAEEVIENTRLHEVAREGRPQIGQLQRMQGEVRVVNRFPIREDGRVVGAIGQVMFKGPEQVQALSREVSRLRGEVALYRRELLSREDRAASLDAIVGDSEPIRTLKSDLLRVAARDVPVLLTGESGTGKELAAHALHRLSGRDGGPMVLVNAAALPPTLVESELFGHEPGAFTGADRKGRKGKIEQADRGTLFLDEIGEMPPDLQAKLLRVLQDGSYERVGGDRIKRSDFRLVAATNRDLRQMIADGRFRLDLYYRISAVVLCLPPLRERLGDIPLLVDTYIASRRSATSVRRVAPEVYDWLREQSWPGNVRQLQHEVERALIFTDGPELEQAAFSRYGATAGAPGQKQRLTSLPAAAAALQADMARDALARTDGNKKRAAAELGISRSHLYKLLREAG